MLLTKEAKESIREIQVDAALAGHDLGLFEPVEVLTGLQLAHENRRIA